LLVSTGIQSQQGPTAASVAVRRYSNLRPSMILVQVGQVSGNRLTTQQLKIEKIGVCLCDAPKSFAPNVTPIWDMSSRMGLNQLDSVTV